MATRTFIARLAHGIADDALTCIALALRPTAKILIAPAMNGKMWQHAATQENVRTMQGRGAEFIGPDAGMLSCGYEGVGRLMPVETIAERAGALPELEIASFDGTPLTDAGLKAAVRGPRLKFLYARDTKVTKQGAGEAGKFAREGVKIVAE